MADTIVNAPGRTDATDSVVGWVIAAVIAFALFVGVIALFRNSSVTPTTPTATTQVNIPNTGTAGDGGTGSATGGSNTGGGSTY